jgi:hypothetical protein
MYLIGKAVGKLAVFPSCVQPCVCVCVCVCVYVCVCVSVQVLVVSWHQLTVVLALTMHCRSCSNWRLHSSIRPYLSPIPSH